MRLLDLPIQRVQKVEPTLLTVENSSAREVVPLGGRAA